MKFPKHPKGMRGWTELCSDVNWEDYGGMWTRQARDGKWYVVRFTNMYDAMGERDCKDGDVAQYEAEVKMLDIEDLTEEDISRALECCGFAAEVSDHENVLDRVTTIHCGSEMVSQDPKVVQHVIVECCIQYGFGAPLDSFTSNVRPSNVRAQARRAAEEYMRNAVKLDTALDRPVNAIGSTAREYGQGDIMSALIRGNSDTHRLMRKLHGIPEEHRVTFGTLRKDGTMTEVRQIRQSDMARCPHFIMMPDHYRSDGSCKCDDPNEQATMIREWGYSPADFAKRA